MSNPRIPDYWARDGHERGARELLALMGCESAGNAELDVLARALDEAEARGAEVAYERCADALNHAIFVFGAGLTLKDASKALSVSRSAIYEARERKPPPPAEEPKR